MSPLTLSLALRPPVSKKASAIARHGGIAPTRFDLLSNDAYFTIDAPWIVPALLAKVRIVGPVLEPAAGVGHLVRELRRGHGLEIRRLLGHAPRLTLGSFLRRILS